MVIQICATVDTKFKAIIQSGNYESIIFELLKASKNLFTEEYVRIYSQSKGECDFIGTDKETGKKTKYDAKLPITTEQGKWIGSNNSRFDKWLESMLSECSEFSSKIIRERGKHSTEELTLYKIMKSQIEEDNEDENIIFFFPFPIVEETSHCIFMQFASDILSNIYDTLEKNGIIKDRKIYAIYPTIDNKIAIRLLNTRTREWFDSKILDKYIKYDVNITAD